MADDFQLDVTARSGRGLGRTLHDDPNGAPMLPTLCIAAAIPVVGAVRGAVDLCRERLRGHVKLEADGVAIDKPAAQMRLARRRAASLPRGDGVLDEPRRTGERVCLRAEIAYAVSQCVEAVDGCCEAIGGSRPRLVLPLQRMLRDVQAMQSHVVCDLDVATELHGRALVGLPQLDADLTRAHARRSAIVGQVS